MIFYFTKSKLIGSKLIRWGLGEDCSHMAIGFQSPAPETVIESRLESGVVGGSLADFLKRNTIVHALELRKPRPILESTLYQIVREKVGGRYDANAMAFWSLAALTKRLVGCKLPRKNPWGSRGEHYCVEIIRGSERLLDDHLGTNFCGVDIEMTSPHMAFEQLLASSKLVLK